MSADAILWHDLECGGYVEDLPLWRELADAHGRDGGILDVGAGTGRVTLHLAAHGHALTALDLDGDLLAALRERAAAAGAVVETVTADARALHVPGRAFGLVLVPMQTVQLLDGPEARGAFLRRARAHLRPGGVLAMAIADPRDGIADDDHPEPPLPDMREVDGVVYASRPVALYEEGGAVAIERIREVVTRAGERRSEGNVVWLDTIDAATLEGEGAAAGLRVFPRREVPQTDVYVGSKVVVLGA